MCIRCICVHGVSCTDMCESLKNVMHWEGVCISLTSVMYWCICARAWSVCVCAHGKCAGGACAECYIFVCVCVHGCA